MGIKPPDIPLIELFNGHKATKCPSNVYEEQRSRARFVTLQVSAEMAAYTTQFARRTCICWLNASDQITVDVMQHDVTISSPSLYQKSLAGFFYSSDSFKQV